LPDNSEDEFLVSINDICTTNANDLAVELFCKSYGIVSVGNLVEFRILNMIKNKKNPLIKGILSHFDYYYLSG